MSSTVQNVGAVTRLDPKGHLPQTTPIAGCSAPMATPAAACAG